MALPRQRHGAIEEAVIVELRLHFLLSAPGSRIIRPPTSACASGVVMAAPRGPSRRGTAAPERRLIGS
jgi:hypothetical protein